MNYFKPLNKRLTFDNCIEDWFVIADKHVVNCFFDFE